MKLRLPIRALAALLLLVAVLVLFISPAFDLPETALRAKSLAQLIVLALIATYLAGFVSNPLVICGCLSRDDCGSVAVPPLDLQSALRC
jgi:hypothetical protein